jgi:hypothetical protein
MNINTIVAVEAIKPLLLKLIYENGEIRFVDMEQYCKTDYFNQLRDWEYFSKVKLVFNVPTFPNGHDIAPETLYFDSKKV